MLVYRLSKSRYAEDVSGEGARLFGGRWNKKLTPCIYTSESRALALLEYTVNISIDEIPRALSMITFEIDDQQIFTITESKLPGNWKQYPAPAETQEFGSALLENPLVQVIEIPSVIIPEEKNYLISPLHYNGPIKIRSIEDFIYDIRVKSI